MGRGSGRPYPFPPASPRGEQAGGSRRAPAVLRGIAAELWPFLFRRFLSPGAYGRVGAPAPCPPAAAPPRFPPCVALASLRKGLGLSPWGRGPSAAQGAFWGGGHARQGARLRARILLGSGTSCTAQGAGGRLGGGHRAAATAPSPPIPQKNAAAVAKPITVCITSCLLLFLPGPRAPPGWGGLGRAALCSVGNGPAPARGARLGERSLSHLGGAAEEEPLSRPLRASDGEGWLRSPGTLLAEA